MEKRPYEPCQDHPNAVEMSHGKVMRTERQQAVAERLGNLAVIVMRKVWAKPGLEAKDLPVNQRGQLRKLEQEGAIEYRDGGWYES